MRLPTQHILNADSEFLYSSFAFLCAVGHLQKSLSYPSKIIRNMFVPLDLCHESSMEAVSLSSGRVVTSYLIFTWNEYWYLMQHRSRHRVFGLDLDRAYGARSSLAVGGFPTTNHWRTCVLDIFICLSICIGYIFRKRMSI